MNNQREIYEALLAGETLISDNGTICTLSVAGITKDSLDNPSYQSFIKPLEWQIHKEPKWYENIPDGGVLAWFNKTICIIYNESSMGNKDMYTPLTRQEINKLMNNAPENKESN